MHRVYDSLVSRMLRIVDFHRYVHSAAVYWPSSVSRFTQAGQLSANVVHSVWNQFHDRLRSVSLHDINQDTFGTLCSYIHYSIIFSTY